MHSYMCLHVVIFESLNQPHILTTIEVCTWNKWTGTLNHTNTLVEVVTAHLSGSPHSKITALETSGTVRASCIETTDCSCVPKPCMLTN